MLGASMLLGSSVKDIRIFRVGVRECMRTQNEPVEKDIFWEISIYVCQTKCTKQPVYWKFPQISLMDWMISYAASEHFMAL